MFNLPTRILRRLVLRGHAMLLHEIEHEHAGVKQADALRHALETLRIHQLVVWTTQGWLASAKGRSYIVNRVRITFPKGNA